MRKLVRVDFNENGDDSAPGSLTVVVNDCERVQTGFLEALREHLISAGHRPTNETVLVCRDADPPQMVLRTSCRCPVKISQLDDALKPVWRNRRVLLRNHCVTSHNGGYVLTAKVLHNY